ncbi:MAG: TIGR02996 domain-containing protein [Deltaproteobacteria bacterium]|nr:TIGR02996 domain-containing protein [Deltaproteobacteria bacterium]
MDLRDLIDAIVASPDDDAPRRVYADALLEAGEPQGELIHIQCDLARGGYTRDEGVARRRRERELLQAHGARWTAGLRGLATFPVFRRGFVDEVVADPERWPENGENIFAAAPALRGVMLDGLTGKDERESEDEASARIMGHWQRAIACPASRRVRGLGYCGLGFECRVFGEVTPGWESLGDQALVALMATDTSRLDSLDIRDSDYRGHEALFISEQMKKLARLAILLHGINDTQDLFRALTGSRIRSLALLGNYLGVLDHPVLATLTELRIDSYNLDLAFPTDTLERFALSAETITADLVDRMISSVRGVRELNLDGDTVPGYRHLERADLLHLRELRVYGSDVGYAEAEAILKMPCAAQLEVLQLKSIDDEGRAALEQRFGVVVDVHDRSRRCVYWR